MNFSELLKKRPRLMLYALIAILVILVSNSLGLNLYNLGQAWDNLGLLWPRIWPPDFSVVTERAAY